MWKIKKVGNDKTIDYAVDELAKYLKMMDQDVKVQEDYNADECICVGYDYTYDSFLPKVADNELDDAIHICVKNKVGVITGTNSRSVLIAVYRYLKELGCAFIRPGVDNEVIPKCNPEETTVNVTEKASYRHREVCIEGATSYEHVSDMIDWIPKIAMNGYFMQFMKPYGFFRKWYNHEDNPYMEADTKSPEELDKIVAKLEDEIALRGLNYFAVGHSWNCEPLNVEGSYWEKEPEPPEHIRKYLAMLDGKRGWYHGVPLDTNLCYSNPEVQELMTNYAVKYCQEHSNIKYLVFWLADETGNRCECEKCKKGTFSDFYVQLLNMLDEKLTALNIDTKIVFSIKPNVPIKETFKSNKRILMMYAPIFRDLSESYPDSLDEFDVELPVFDENEKNLNRILRPIKNTVANLRNWQKVYDGDNEVYDYQLIWFIHENPGYMFCSKTMSKDIKNLKTIGVNGVNSCQVQRLFFPTALPMLTMAETLWNRETDFDEYCNRYFKEAFGNDGNALKEILTKIDQPKLTHIMETFESLNWEKTAGKETLDMLDVSYKAIEDLKALVERNVNNSEHPDAVKQSWNYLTYYVEFAKLYIDIWKASYGENDVEKAENSYDLLVDYLNKNEPVLNRVIDNFMFCSRLNHFFKKRSTPTVHE